MSEEKRCPICSKPADKEHRPFCSPRCANLDLQRWFTGRYAISGEKTEGESDPEDLF